MPVDIIINFTEFETRIAFLENNRVTKIFIERASERGLVGNIYKGKIIKVLPGMQSCFVDIGLEKAAFLYIDDAVSKLKESSFSVDLEIPEKKEYIEENLDFSYGKKEKITKKIKITDVVKEGEEILVQVLKDPFGTKGARITTNISLAGRFLVYMPTVNHVGISRKIELQKEKDRLKEIIDEVKIKDGGYIGRTLAVGASKKSIKDDVVFLDKLWKQIKSKSNKTPIGKIVYYDLDIVLKTVRDFLSDDINKLIIDNKTEYKKILRFIESFSPQFKNLIHLYTGEDSIFDSYSIETTLNRALSKKVWLKSGGYIVIDQTEALIAIDVNSGRYVGHRNLEDTILKINLEAISEIVDQIQMRNIGGIIIIDFIDMEKQNNRDKVYNVLKETLKRDKAKINILNFSEFGLVQMTRQRTSRNLRDIMASPCPYCEGRGHVKSLETMAYEILREINRELIIISKETPRNKCSLVIYCNPLVAKHIYEKMNAFLEGFEKKQQVKIIIEPNEQYHIEQFEIYQKIDQKPDGKNV